MCVNVTKIGQGHPKLLWCNTCIRPTNLPSCQIWSPYLTSRRCNGSRNIRSVREAPKIRGVVCTPISRKQKVVRKKSPVRWNTLRPSAIRCTAQIGSRPTDIYFYALDLNAKAGARGPEVSQWKSAPKSCFWKFYLSVCQCHKSRSRLSDVTVGTMHQLDLPSCQI